MKKIIGLFVFILLISCSESDNEISLPTSKQLNFSVLEYTSNGSIIGDLNLPASPSNYGLSIVSQNPENAFSLDSATGNIKVANSSLFDFDLYKTISGKVKVVLENSEKITDILIRVEDDYRVLNGGVQIENQFALDMFLEGKYDKVNGGISLFSQEINNLDGFYTLKSSYSFTLVNTSIKNLDGLRNLSKIDKAPSAAGFSGFTLVDNLQLENIDGLSNLIESNFITIENSPYLKNIDGLSNLEQCQIISIERNNSIQNIDAFSKLNKPMSQFLIGSNDNLQNIDGLKNIPSTSGYVTISNNKKLKSVNLVSLTSCSYLQIINNSELNDFCGLTHFFNNNTSFSNYDIYSNKFNPNVQDMSSGNCS